MPDPISTVNGIASGIQWQSMVEQIIALENKRSVTPLTAKQTALTSAASAWKEFASVVDRFTSATKAIRDGSAFGQLSVSGGTSLTSGRSLLSATAEGTAVPGTYDIQVLQIAAAEKLGGAVSDSATTALGISGAFVINGRTLFVEAADTLNSLRDKLNLLDSGTNATGVTASVLRGSGGARIALTADRTGFSGIELVDDANGTLHALGFADGSASANITASGATQTFRLNSSTAIFASLFGIPLPTPSTIKVGGQTITVDFTVDSLSTVAARINAATGLTDAASVVSETIGGRTYSRLQTRLAVEPNVADVANSTRILSVLGFTTAGRGSVAQVVKSANTYTDAGNSGADAVASTLLSNLQVGGQSLGLSAGTVITISGSRGDGSAVTRSLTLDANTTVQQLLDSANDVTTGFAAGTRTASLSLGGGALSLQDSINGDSLLSMSLTATKSGGQAFSLGIFSTANGGTVGLNRQIIAGQDARIKVDGQTVTRNTNTISDAISGVTLNLLAAEGGSNVSLTLARNLDSIVTSMKTLASTYNDVRSWADSNAAKGMRLANNSALKAMTASLSSTLLESITGLTGVYTTPAAVGLSRDKAGNLSLDSTIFQAALTSGFEDVKKLFSASGIPTDPEVAFIGSTESTLATSSPYEVVISQAATSGSVTGSAFATYSTTGTPDAINVTDASTGKVGSVSLANGDSIESIVGKLNSAFATQKMNLLASLSGGAVKISANDYGSGAGFTVSYTPGSSDATAQLGISANSYSGLNVAGTIGGLAAVGNGRYLTGASGTAVEGLRLMYSGTTARSAGTVAFSVGMGGMLYKASTGISRDLDGRAFVLAANATLQADALHSRITAAQDRLVARKASLTAQFIAMESAMSKAQSLSSSLTSTINGLFSYNKQV